MPARLMQGPVPVRESIVRVLRSEIPKTIDKYNSQYGSGVRYPEFYEEYEVEGVRHGSGAVLSVSVSNARNLATVDTDDWAAMQYLARYLVTVYGWITTEAEEDGSVPVDARVRTLRERDMLAVCIRATILNNPALDDPERYALIENTLEEDYSDASPTPNASGRYLSGVTHTFVIEVEEQLDRTGTTYLDSPVIVDPHYFPHESPDKPEVWPDGVGSVGSPDEPVVEENPEPPIEGAQP